MEGSLTEQQLGLRQAEDRLYRDYIHRLLKQSTEYPKYQYICKLCSVHIEHIQAAHKHIKEKRHKKKIMEKHEENELRSLPPPSVLQLRALDTAVKEAARQHGISEKDFEHRKAVVTRMEDIIKKHLSACTLSLYGSCLTRFAFKTSDINIDVNHPSTAKDEKNHLDSYGRKVQKPTSVMMTHPEVLIQVLDILKNSTEFSEVVADFHAKVPAIICRDVISGLMCNVSAGNDVACLSTNHMAALAKLEPRLVPLVLAFRYWARLCHIDCQVEGGVPSYSFALMVIFFLQQRKEPILPVYFGHWIDGFDVKCVDDYHLTGIHSDMYVQWEHKPSRTMDGQEQNRNKAKGEGKSKPERSKSDKAQFSHGLARLSFELCKNVSLGQLWLELMRFYTLEFALEEYIISIRLKALLSREMKNWPRRRLAIEDPFALKRNVARSLNSQMVFEYIQERFRTAYKYFACPQTKGRMEQKSKMAGNRGFKLLQVEEEEEPLSKCGRKIETNLIKVTDDKIQVLFQQSKDNCENVTHYNDHSNESIKEDGKILDGNLMEMSHSKKIKASEHLSRPSLSINGLLDKEEMDEKNCYSENEGIITSEELHYIFDQMIFTGGKPPNVVCSICKRDGHLKDECPDDFKKIELKPLPPMNNHFREILNGVCKLCHYELAPTHAEQQKREELLASLERFIRKDYNDKAQLCLFGSSKNGFGFHDSDLDICMTLEGHETAEKLNCKEIIENLAKVLKNHAGLRNILPITTAKVPIVKFEHRQSGLEGDISLYNTLAQHNTRMLAMYAALDERVQFLGYMMKVFAKIFDGTRVPQKIVDGWNAFFFDDLEDLHQHLSMMELNTESVGELWLGLLRFYTEEFDFKEHVISIRQKKRLTTFEKQWTSKCIAIEDPFDLNHNLGAGVSRKMTNFIMKAFINGRKLFGTPFYPVPGTEVDYFFDAKVLTDGELAPNDRCCRICGKIGHYMKDCPKRRRLKKKENEKDDDVKVEERDQTERRCFQCGATGHVRRDCPEYRHLKQRTAGTTAPHTVQSLVNSQSITDLQALPDSPQMARLPSESSDSLQTLSYSPQPPAMSQSCPQSCSSPRPTQNKTICSGPQKQLTYSQVPLSIFNFPSSHPGQYQLGTHSSLGPLPTHQLQSHPLRGQSHHSTLIPSPSWPIHRSLLSSNSTTTPSPPGLKCTVPSASGRTTSSGGSPKSKNVNDPRIIFAQPAGRPVGIGGPGHEGYWLNHLAQPGSLMENGTVVKSELGHPAQFIGATRGSQLWEHNKTPQYTLSWPNRIPQKFIQQANSGSQTGSGVQSNPNLLIGPHIRHPVNLKFIQQKK
ncbi:terminal uridylyltransferase 4 isoform X3 [Syngnathoides biaculeatus]|uniref:terminal uridylyltransferase 4 isoform X3 n=1 Tax=Syngnathoides biaculeatus TaxID=300417 RepID=UPI002ADE0984|nr:terminal uridylyltransferase 4 isoform X3 [Syngnathoides biaculeatus]